MSIYWFPNFQVIFYRVTCGVFSVSCEDFICRVILTSNRFQLLQYAESYQPQNILFTFETEIDISLSTSTFHEVNLTVSDFHDLAAIDEEDIFSWIHDVPMKCPSVV